MSSVRAWPSTGHPTGARSPTWSPHVRPVPLHPPVPSFSAISAKCAAYAVASSPLATARTLSAPMRDIFVQHALHFSQSPFEIRALKLLPFLGSLGFDLGRLFSGQGDRRTPGFLFLAPPLVGVCALSKL